MSEDYNTFITYMYLFVDIPLYVSECASILKDLINVQLIIYVIGHVMVIQYVMVKPLSTLYAYIANSIGLHICYNV